MPRVTVDGFIGPSNKLRSVNVDCERTINFMLELTAPGRAKVPMWMRPTPGLRPWLILPTSPVRAQFQQDGRAWAIGGGVYYEVFADATYVARGSVATDSFQGAICSNGTAGNQNFVVSGGVGYINDLLSNSLTALVSPTNIRMCEFMDGYFLAQIANSRQFAISNLNDGTVWDPLDIAERSQASDDIAAMIRNHREIFFLGTKTSEPWVDIGDPLFPFAPSQGTLIEHGTPAPFTVQRLDNTIFFLGVDDTGAAMVWRMEGYTPIRISTHAVEKAIQNAGSTPNNDFSASVAWVYQQDGHSFFVLQVPNAETTWVYDQSTQLWHERARWDAIREEWVRHPAQNHMYFAGKHLVGDRTSGAIYDQSLDYFDEQIVT